MFWTLIMKILNFINILKILIILILFKVTAVDALGFPETKINESPVKLARLLDNDYIRHRHDWAAINTHVAIVAKLINPDDQSVSIIPCTGFLIKPNKILTAAHCLYLVDKIIKDGMVRVQPTIIQNLVIVYGVDENPIAFRHVEQERSMEYRIKLHFRDHLVGSFPTYAFFTNNFTQIAELNLNSSNILRIDIPPGVRGINSDFAMLSLRMHFEVTRIPEIIIPTDNPIKIPYIYRFAYGLDLDRHWEQPLASWGLLKEIYFPFGATKFDSIVESSSYKVYNYSIDKLDAGGAFLIGNDHDFKTVTLAGILLGESCVKLSAAAGNKVYHPHMFYEPRQCNGYISRIDTKFPWIDAMLNNQANTGGIRCILDDQSVYRTIAPLRGTFCFER